MVAMTSIEAVEKVRNGLIWNVDQPGLAAEFSWKLKERKESKWGLLIRFKQLAFSIYFY